MAVTFYACFSVIATSYFSIGFKINTLTKNITAEILHNLANPPPPNKFLWIYDEQYCQQLFKKSSILLPGAVPATPEIPPTQKVSSAQGFSFAERLHAPRPPPELTDEHFHPSTRKISTPFTRGLQRRSLINRLSAQKQSRIKKISTAIQNFFNQDDEISQGREENSSSFISQRGVGSFVKSTPFPVHLPASMSQNQNQPPKKDQLESSSNVVLNPGVVASANIFSSSTVSVFSTSSSSSDHNKNDNAPKNSTGSAQPDSQAMPEDTSTPYQFQNRAKELADELEEQMREEAYFTLQHLKRLKGGSRNSLITLIVFFFLTWVPNLMARFLRTDYQPLYLCSPLISCWSNADAYAYNSIFINSTLNAFFYCFGSVHFRKQVRLFIRPCRDKVCGKKKKKKKVVVKKRVRTAKK